LLEQLFCSLTSFFNAHAATRSFSNSTETALTTMALAWWPWPEEAIPEEDKEERQKGHAKDGYVSSLVLSKLEDTE
jgi:hypothetical protein